MNRAVILGLAFGFVTPLAALAGESIKLSLAVDQDILAVGESTILHVFAEVEGGSPDNGIFAFALNLLETSPPIIGMSSVLLLGDPLESLSDIGTIGADGLRDVYGGDGGFVTDPSRGINEPFEILSLTIQGEQVGVTRIEADVADSANVFGIPDGFLLQDPGGIDVKFDGVRVQVVPEPTSGFVLLFAAAAALRRSRRRDQV